MCRIKITIYLDDPNCDTDLSTVLDLSQEAATTIADDLGLEPPDSDDDPTTVECVD